MKPISAGHASINKAWVNKAWATSPGEQKRQGFPAETIPARGISD